MQSTPVILAGIGDSGPEHWQSLWQQRLDAVKLQHTEWNAPVCDVWVKELDDLLASIPGDVTLVAHSLACLQVAHWAVASARRVRGALLVAVPDPTGPRFPREARGFGNLPSTPLPFTSVVVASTNDPYGTLEFAKRCAGGWGSRFHLAGALGHINASSGLGAWDEGLAIFHELNR